MDPQNLGAAKRQLKGSQSALSRAMAELRAASEEISRLRNALDNAERIISVLVEDEGGEISIPLHHLQEADGIVITQEATDESGPDVVIRLKEPRHA